ncbi:hypothetical protein SODALDRAFT_359628 [Sodiomyces alkalinus F11]|uniref:Uncharacterized protein n=1 Tax=Sodiomyces alkalinus (strain CBS 110278 / VKM F-3762 / F11) TaxID=1314773 RepID=A0A3N2PVL7_SODAK|nr:hypothetical protein SODALDRAFT_359628 [Sodiomyces alkalinus F11]ROT38528.1 hypothetical protein SODALDRAFT_359628 [Sodiomyces alkalinus F11]
MDIGADGDSGQACFAHSALFCVAIPQHQPERAGGQGREWSPVRTPDITRRPMLQTFECGFRVHSFPDPESWAYGRDRPPGIIPSTDPIHRSQPINPGEVMIIPPGFHAVKDGPSRHLLALSLAAQSYRPWAHRPVSQLLSWPERGIPSTHTRARQATLQRCFDGERPQAAAQEREKEPAAAPLGPVKKRPRALPASLRPLPISR